MKYIIEVEISTEKYNPRFLLPNIIAAINGVGPVVKVTDTKQKPDETQAK